MSNRRSFLRSSLLATTAGLLGLPQKVRSQQKLERRTNSPAVISTWNFGLAANEAAWKVLSSGGRALDAVEQGVWVPEADPENNSVGIGGLPDRDGHVTLDACIMDEHGHCGSVAVLEHILHPISVARQVMEKTPHVMLVGDGALRFALANGFTKQNLLTEKAKKDWEEWKAKNHYSPQPVPNHDTIGMVALDAQGNLSGACTTSGRAFKYHGRIGDSPIIGAGLYVDNEVGGAAATGIGEEVIKICGSFLIVELMRSGKSPQEACAIAIDRISQRHPKLPDGFQVGFIALSVNGDVGGATIGGKFDYALYKDGKNQVFNAPVIR